MVGPKGRPPRLVFLAPGDVRKGRVEPISWMRTCSAFSDRGFDAWLVSPLVRRPDSVPASAIWKHFDVAPSFRLLELPVPLRHDAGVRSFRLWAGLATALVALGVLAAQLLWPRRLIVYGRSPILLLPFLGLRRLLPPSRRPSVVYETHVLPNRYGAAVARGADLVVATSSKLSRDIADRLGVPPARVLNAPLGPYNEIRRHPKAEARARLGLPSDAVIACYCGKMIEEQNEFLLRAAAGLTHLPGFRLLLVGGNARILEWTSTRVAELGLEGRVILAGFVEPASVDVYQAAADVLVFHMADSLPHWAYCTPAKGFDYMAAGRPVVATDLPLFEEVFGADGERAIRVRERTPAALARGIETALSLGDGGREMTERASEFVRARTWGSRVDSVLEALGR
jgi:glycosyltransferase involved in cell wall biosynthesis